MGKQILTNGFVSINGVDLSDHAFSLDTPDVKEQIDVSGFSSSGNREFLPGQREQTVTIGLLQDFAANKVHATLSALFEAASAFPFTVAANGSSITSTNPKWSGTAQLYEYNGIPGSLNGRLEMTATLKPASGGVWAWATS